LLPLLLRRRHCSLPEVSAALRTGPPTPPVAPRQVAARAGPCESPPPVAAGPLGVPGAAWRDRVFPSSRRGNLG
jgi:hypothetical protein